MRTWPLVRVLTCEDWRTVGPSNGVHGRWYGMKFIGCSTAVLDGVTDGI